jgi:hypothetical protein
MRDQHDKRFNPDDMPFCSQGKERRIKAVVIENELKDTC